MAFLLKTFQVMTPSFSVALYIADECNGGERILNKSMIKYQTQVCSEHWEGSGQNLNFAEFWLLDKVDLVRK